MKILKAIAVLLNYPTPALLAGEKELCNVINENYDYLSSTNRASLLQFIENHFSQDILDWQSDYDSLFERGRNLSLLLFEHVHGESRDRGQAMVDLIEQYQKAGLEIGIKELPDHIPLFLEFLSTQEEEDAQAWLMDVSHILALLLARLEERNSDYSALFSALIEISQVKLDLSEIKRVVKTEERDDTQEAIDKVWEEEMVRFGPDQSDSSCSTEQMRPSENQSRVHDMPITILDATQPVESVAQVKE